MTIPQIRMVTVRSIRSPVAAENKQVIVFGKITEIKFQYGRNLLNPGIFYRLSQTDDTDTGINFFYRIGIGSDNICIKDLCYLNNYFFAPANGTEIVMKDRDPHCISPIFINPLSTISSGTYF